MVLDHKDLELIERVIYKNGDDIAVSVSRSFERLEERIDAAEARLNFRFTQVEDKLAASEQKLTGELTTIRDVLNQ